jgi:hypothetical protein
MTDIVDDIFIRTPGYGTPFGIAFTCRICGCLVDGTQYAPAPTPRQAHAAWHEQIADLARLALAPAPASGDRA